MAKNLRLLVVDDDQLIHQAIEMALPENWSMFSVNSLKDIPLTPFTAAIVDMHLTKDTDKSDGLKVISKLASNDPHLDIIAMSGDLDPELLEDCLRAGACRFLAKPLSPEEFVLTIEKVEAFKLLQEASMRSSQTGAKWLGKSSEAKDVQRQIANLKGEGGPILLEGDSGTGKEVVAQILHQQESSRPWICVNVASLPENLFESELFGHVRGAFTGADQNKMGLAEAANNGDLFLDEIEALPLELQAKLLRFLESGEIRRVGAKSSIHVNVRVIAATNRNLNQMVESNEFREDLLWRLSARKILLPKLAQRKDDIPELAQYFTNLQRPRHNKQFSDEALISLKNYNWPGNVRELKRACEQLCLIAPLPIIRAEDVAKVVSTSVPSFSGKNINLNLGLSDLMEQYEAHILKKSVVAENNDVDAIAKLLKISRSSLYKKIKDYNIELN